MLSRSLSDKALQWAIYAYGGFGSHILSKDEDIELIHKKAVFISRYGEWNLLVLNYFDDDIYRAEEAMVNHYQGKFNSERDFAESLFDKECGISIPEHMKLYIDYGSFKADIFQNEYFSFEIGEKETHIFSIRLIA